MKAVFALVLVVSVLAVAVGAPQAALEGPVFSSPDPSGDDYGPGTYVYPKNRAFYPYHGLFDLTSFAVYVVDEIVRFDLTLADLRNPWRAPEGFSQQLFEIYIHRPGGAGRTEPLSPGANVLFAKDFPWDVLIKVAPWESSELAQILPDGNLARQALAAGVAGRNTVRVNVPIGAIGIPAASWRYYVLVGSYDGFGDDNFRPVMAKAGEWHFGGGRDDTLDPNVLDILGPERGRFSQKRQLGGYEEAPAVLMPMGPGFVPGRGGFPWWMISVPAGVLILAALWSWYAPPVWREKAKTARRAFWKIGTETLQRLKPESHRR